MDMTRDDPFWLVVDAKAGAAFLSLGEGEGEESCWKKERETTTKNNQKNEYGTSTVQ